MAVYDFFIVLYTQAGDRESVIRSSLKWSTPIFEITNHFSNLTNFICSQLILCSPIVILQNLLLITPLICLLKRTAFSIRLFVGTPNHANYRMTVQ